MTKKKFETQMTMIFGAGVKENVGALTEWEY